MDDAEHLAVELEVADQTIACRKCGNAWWAENNTDDPTLFHESTCPLFGRRDVAEFVFNLSLIEESLGHTCGADASIGDWKRLARHYIIKYQNMKEADFQRGK